MKWVKFKDETPRSRIIYITDFTSVWTSEFFPNLGWKAFAINNPDYGWAEIPIPETPERPEEPHSCSRNGLLCFETQSTLFIKYYAENERYLSKMVNFCPLCGYQVKEKT